MISFEIVLIRVITFKSFRRLGLSIFPYFELHNSAGLDIFYPELHVIAFVDRSLEPPKLSRKVNGFPAGNQARDIRAVA